MAHEHHESDTREDRLNDVLAVYLDAERIGSPPDRVQLLAQNPDLAEDLRSFFRDKDRFAHLAEPLHPAANPANAVTQAPSQCAMVDPTLGRLRYIGDYELLQEIAR